MGTKEMDWEAEVWESNSSSRATYKQLIQGIYKLMSTKLDKETVSMRELCDNRLMMD